MNIYVGNLSYGVTDSDLEEAFSEFGAVAKAQVVMDKATGRSKGFGFVEMTNDDEARAAMEKLNGQDIKGRTVVVNEARPRTEQRARF